MLRHSFRMNKSRGKASKIPKDAIAPVSSLPVFCIKTNRSGSYDLIGLRRGTTGSVKIRKDASEPHCSKTPLPYAPHYTHAAFVCQAEFLKICRNFFRSCILHFVLHHFPPIQAANSVSVLSDCTKCHFCLQSGLTAVFRHAMIWHI